MMNLTVTETRTIPLAVPFHAIPFGDWFWYPDKGLCIKIDHKLGWDVINKERFNVSVEDVHTVKVNVKYELVGPKE